ncbi:cytochrome c-type biogenesis protein [Caulobacter sp. NIBR1757]|uniref:cytochrome c-type biogenesis protein n=1 Tax=Caulobacter sp. NIBR1757 TaxID=3016000 RepID=UPI0022F13364|nr:cytochrome c-type biogenesis protein [Caulobacter sp. NIBR1757]WGM40172.1 Cytochrome c-type biogenesis protein CcmH [Caulobacter sp. NIBR1757]
MKRLLIALAAFACIAAASDPSERLADPAQEARARSLFREVRCLVCQNESIDDSTAELAHDLRQVIREQIAAGRSDQDIRDFLVARYGEFALLKPAVSAPNALLWGGPIIVLLVGGGLLILRLRGRPAPAALSPEEEARLAQLTREGRD